MGSQQRIETLSEVMLWRGIPERIRSDNGPPTTSSPELPPLTHSSAAEIRLPVALNLHGNAEIGRVRRGRAEAAEGSTRHTGDSLAGDVKTRLLEQ